MKRILAVYVFLVFMMLAWAFGAQAQLGSNDRGISTDTIDANTAAFIDFLTDIEISSTGYVLLPKGTTAQRPGSPVAGMFRYNTTDNTFEGYTTEWGPIAGGGGGVGPFEPNEEYEINQNVIEDDKLWYANATFTAGATFDPANWTLVSPVRLVDGVTKIDRGGTLFEAGSRNPEYVELIDDPSFQAGVTEWSCTNATIEQVTNASSSNLDHGVDRSQTAAKITVTADGGYCEIVKTIGTSQAGTYVPSVYYASSSANAFIEFARDSRARVVDGLDFINSGDYEFLSAQLIASTGLSVRLGGNNTDVIYADMASMELGGYNRSASKNCSGVLNCENEFSAVISSTGSVSSTGKDWVSGVAISDSSLFDVSFVAELFSSAPECSLTPVVADSFTSTQDVRHAMPTTPSKAVVRTYGASTSGDFFKNAHGFHISCSKQGADYKTTEDQGVTIIPDNKDARLVVTNEGTTSDVTIGAATVTVGFDTEKLSRGISWNTTTDEGTFQKSGEYEIDANIGVYASTGTSTFKLFPEIDTGSGFAALPDDDSGCGITTAAVSESISCRFVFSAEKNDKIRIRVSSTSSNGTYLSSSDRYPRLLITPLGGGEAVVENSGTTVYQGERGTLTAGYASFGGATDESFCSASPCTRHREVGALGENMSATRISTGNYEITVTGFRANSNAKCSCNAVASVSAGSNLRLCVLSSLLQADGSGELVFPIATTFDDFQPGNRSDSYFQVKCEGLAP